MRLSNLFGKDRFSGRLVSLGAASLLALALAGCGGGGGGTTTAAAPAGGGGSGAGGGSALVSTDPTGTAVIDAAAANPTTTNTAANPSQVFGLIVNAGSTPVTVNSPPKVYFTVIDSKGKFVSGLKLVVPAGQADAACTTSTTATTGNLRFTIAKLAQPTDGSPSTWQNLISLQRYATSSTGKNSVAEGTTDPLPTATFNNADTNAAIADPSKRVVGILKESTASGYYTYYFATDVVNPLLFADAVSGANGVSGKVANNGNVAVKDGKMVHRLGMQLCYTDPGSGAKVVVNPVLDFTLGADGIGVPVKDSSNNLALVKKAVDKASCNECHETLKHHGTRVDPSYCVTCHNPGTKDFQTGNLISLPIMIHKLHMGEDLINDWQVRDVHAHDIGFPQDPRNCTKCHDNTKAAQGDNWKNVPNRAACGACHDGINFDTGKGVTLADAAKGLTVSSYGHPGGAQANDTLCAQCHKPADIAVYHEPTIASPHNATVQNGVARFQYKITSVTINAASQVVVDFQILKNDTPVALNAYSATGQLLTGYTGGPAFYVAYATGQDGIVAPSDWNSGHDSLSLKDAWASANGNTLTVKDATTSTYEVTIAASTTGRSPSHSLTLPGDAKMVTALMAGAFNDAIVTENGGNLPGIPDMKAATGNTPDGKANVARRVIADVSKCNTCHDRLGTHPNFHGGNYSIIMCPACHTPNQGGSTGWSASFRVWVHGIHGQSKRTIPFTWHAVSKTDTYANLVLPEGRQLKNCESCHFPGTYDFSASQYTATDASGKTIMDSMLYIQAATGKLNPASATNYVFPQAAPVGSGTYAYGLIVDNVQDYGTGNSIDPATGKLIAQTTQGNNLVSSPITGTCTSCHDSDAALTHITTTGYGSFYRPRTAALAATKEQCLFCHGPGKLVPIKDAHNPASAPW